MACICCPISETAKFIWDSRSITVTLWPKSQTKRGDEYWSSREQVPEIGMTYATRRRHFEPDSRSPPPGIWSRLSIRVTAIYATAGQQWKVVSLWEISFNIDSPGAADLIHRRRRDLKDTNLREFPNIRTTQACKLTSSLFLHFWLWIMKYGFNQIRFVVSSVSKYYNNCSTSVRIGNKYIAKISNWSIIVRIELNHKEHCQSKKLKGVVKLCKYE